MEYWMRYETFHEPYWKGYKKALANWRWTRWNDDDPFLDDYIGHSMMGGITSAMLGPGNKLLFEFQSDTNSYYILLRGEALTNITTPMALTLGTSDSAQLTDNTPISAAWTFIRVLRVPLTQPLDLDKDGIDDIYELRHANFLDPLNPADALQDFDHDGITNLQEYRAGTDPIVSEYIAPIVMAPVASTKDLIVTLTGSAQPNRRA